MWLLVSSEVPLRCGVELYHRFGEWLGVILQGRKSGKHGLVKGTVDLLQGFGSREIHEEKRGMAEEPIRKRMTTGVGWWVTGTDKLDSFESNELLIGGTPESVLLSYLP